MNVDPRYTPDLDGFLAYKRRNDQEYAPSTDRKWRPIIADFERHREELGVPLKEITSETLDMLLLPAMEQGYIERYDREPSKNTWRGWYDALRSYFRYLHAVGHLSVNPMLALKKPKYEVDEIDCLTPTEDEALAAVGKDPLEEAVVGLAREAGLRAEEIAELADDDVDLDGGKISVRRGKTKTSARDIPIVLTLAPKLARYRAYKAEQGLVSPRFIMTKSGRISTGYVWVIVKRVAARAGVRLHATNDDGTPKPLGKGGQNVSAVSPHVLRRTFGLDLLNRDVALPIVSDLLGHANQAITEKAYARYLKEVRARQALFAAEGGPYAASRAVLGLEKAVVQLSEKRTPDPQTLLAQIEELMVELDSVRNSITSITDAQPEPRPALRVVA